MKKNRKVSIYFVDILECIEHIEEYSRELTFSKLKVTFQVQDAIIRRLEIIGEATKQLPEELRKKYPDIPWKFIAGTRDMLIHEYFGVDLKEVWKIVKDDLPKLKESIRELLILHKGK